MGVPGEHLDELFLRYVLRCFWKNAFSMCDFSFFRFAEDMEDIWKWYGKTSFCVTLKGATLSYPQGVPEDVFLRHP